MQLIKKTVTWLALLVAACPLIMPSVAWSVVPAVTARTGAPTPKVVSHKPLHHEATQLTWYGQSAFRLVTPNGHVLFIDPWLQNPVNPQGKQILQHIQKADLILITHGHFDHVGDASAIARQTQARLVATYDLGNALAEHGGFPKERMSFETLGNAGGVLSFFNGEVRIAFIPAVHSSSVNGKALGATEDSGNYPAGAPGGFVIAIKNGPTLYHTGDTDLFGDMALVRQYGHIDWMLTCIGDHFTMGPERAAQAVRLVNPTHAAPMHYGTFVPLMTGKPEAFHKALSRLGLGSRFKPLSVGQTVSL